MGLKKRIKNVNILLLFKTSIGATIAILIANRLGLLYSSSAEVFIN